jgi:hypothetical protein
MPIFEIRALPQSEAFDVEAAMKKLCSSVAEAALIDETSLHASWHELPPGREDAEWDDGDPIVRVISFEGESDARIERMLDTAARVVADQLHIDPRNVCVTYEEAHSGRVETGHTAR